MRAMKVGADAEEAPSEEEPASRVDNELSGLFDEFDTNWDGSNSSPRCSASLSPRLCVGRAELLPSAGSAEPGRTEMWAGKHGASDRERRHFYIPWCQQFNAVLRR